MTYCTCKLYAYFRSLCFELYECILLSFFKIYILCHFTFQFGATNISTCLNGYKYARTLNNGVNMDKCD